MNLALTFNSLFGSNIQSNRIDNTISRDDFFSLQFGINLKDLEILLYKTGSIKQSLVIPFAPLYQDPITTNDGMLMKKGEAVAAFSLLQPATVPTALV